MASQFRIETDVPPPARQGGVGNARFPLDHLEVGHSFYVPWGDSELKTRSVVSNAVAAHKLRNPGRNYATRKDASGVRVWRTA